jgi:hypothetical protein
MLVKSKERIILKFFFWMLILKITRAQICSVLQSKNIYGSKRSNFDQNLCFEVQVDDLKEIIVHTNLNLVGFTFNFKDGTTRNFMETSGSSNDFRIDLSTSDLIGCKIYVGEGIEGLEFQLYDWITNQESSSAVMGQSGGCFSFFNSSSLNIKCLKIDSIQGCIDKNGSSYFPFLSFSYSFSQCPFRTLSSTNIDTTSTITTEKTPSPSTTLESKTSTATNILSSDTINTTSTTNTNTTESTTSPSTALESKTSKSSFL